MAPLRVIVLLLALAAATSAVEIRFVPAMPDGTVSLGIFDASGKLARLLCDEWPMSRFSAELDGLTTEWDGKDSAGQPVPAGTYRARGFVVGNVGVEGDAFYFNDWITSGDAPRIVSVGAVALLPGGNLLLAARLAGGEGALLCYSPEATDPWKLLAEEPLPDAVGKVKIAVASGRIFILTDKKIRALDLSDGKEIPVPSLASEPLDISARDKRLLVLARDKLDVFDSSNFTKLSEFSLPAAGASGAALLEDDSIVVVGNDGSLWHGAPKWIRIEAPEGTKVNSVAAGRAATFWALEQRGNGPSMVVQYSPDEGRLAEWVSNAAGDPVGLCASTEGDVFCAIFATPSAERTLAIGRSADGTWKIAADKTITASASFGLRDGKLSASSGELPAELTLRLVENPLDPAATRNLRVRAVANSGGTGLATDDGLPLVRVSGEHGFERVMVLPGSEPNTAQFYQGDGACVEQYSLGNLGDIAAFDAGTIQMEGGAEKPPPPVEDYADPTP